MDLSPSGQDGTGHVFNKYWKNAEDKVNKNIGRWPYNYTQTKQQTVAPNREPNETLNPFQPTCISKSQKIKSFIK